MKIVKLFAVITTMLIICLLAGCDYVPTPTYIPTPISSPYPITVTEPNPYPNAPVVKALEETYPALPEEPEEPEDPIPPTVVSFWEMPIQYAAYEMRFRWMLPSGNYEGVNAHLTIEYTDYDDTIRIVDETLPFYSHTTINGYPGAIYRDTIPYTGLRSATITDAWVWNTVTQQRVNASNLPYFWVGLEHSWFAPIIRYIHSPHY